MPFSPPSSYVIAGAPSLLAVHSLDRGVMTEVEGTIHDGDYVIEVSDVILYGNLLNLK